jgi:hypothetical protein
MYINYTNNIQYFIPFAIAYIGEITFILEKLRNTIKL